MEKDDLYVEPGTVRLSQSNERKARSKSDNPYLKFIKNFHWAARQDPSKITLGRKSAETTNMIIQDFIDWYKTLESGEDEDGSAGESAIDSNKLHQLFQMSFDKPVPVVKQRPAKPSQGEIMEVINLKNSGHSIHDHSSKDLETMTTVWQGIENSRSAVAFANWLQKHKENPPPTYLKNIGLLDISYDQVLAENLEFTNPLNSTLILPIRLPHKQAVAAANKKKIIRPCRSVYRD